ncbi:dUTP diphosphatase [Methanobrevibacter sp.]|uniref:dUTP diphosphatase n=1 Tax=Methanobrevibacter sp. TaxID=66852 RepID=UPI00386A6AA8
MQIKIKRIGNGKLPVYKTKGSAGADCYAHIEKQIILKAGNRIKIPLGFAVEIPEGYEMQIRGRSGIADRNGVDDFIGTIDSDYRGEVCAILINKSIEDFIIEPGDRIAQAVVAPVIKAEWNEVEKLSDTERGAGGFGSTGVSNEEKFYEPFRSSDVDEIRKLIGKEVIFDNNISGIISNVFGTKEITKSYYIEIKFHGNQKYCGLDFIELSLVNAFQRVKIDGHRFGKEIGYEEKID